MYLFTALFPLYCVQKIFWIPSLKGLRFPSPNTSLKLLKPLESAVPNSIIGVTVSKWVKYLNSIKLATALEAWSKACFFSTAV